MATATTYQHAQQGQQSFVGHSWYSSSKQEEPDDVIVLDSAYTNTQPDSEYLTEDERDWTDLLSGDSDYHTATEPIPSIFSFTTTSKLKSVEQVMRENTGTDTLSLRKLATALAREAIFGRKEMTSKSLSGRHSTEELDKQKVNYIKSLVHSRIPNKSEIEFESIWKQCRGSISKSCQTLRNSEKKKTYY